MNHENYKIVLKGYSNDLKQWVKLDFTLADCGITLAEWNSIDSQQQIAALEFALSLVAIARNIINTSYTITKSV